jgi:hypothetical protein
MTTVPTVDKHPDVCASGPSGWPRNRETPDSKVQQGPTSVCLLLQDLQYSCERGGEWDSEGHVL